MKDWRMAQSSRTSLTSLTQIQGIYREIQETLAREFRPFSRLSPENRSLSTARLEFGTGNLIRRIREFAGRIQAAIDRKMLCKGHPLQRKLTGTLKNAPL
jgi:hypothetical protein